jgi:hypothetical protein
MQQEQQQTQLSASTLPGPGQPDREPVMVNGIPVEDAVEQMQLQLQMVQSRLRSAAASVSGHACESYEYTYQWVVANCSPEDWQYSMDMPALYSLVRPEGQNHDVMLTEEFNSSKAGYASSAHASLSLSFKTKIPAKSGHPFSAIAKYSDWESIGIKKGFRDLVEEIVRALEASTSKSMSVHMTHKVAAHRILLTLLTDSVQQMLKIHRMMDAQFQRYRQVLGVVCDESKWILSSQFAEAVFVVTWRARLIGSDVFSETGHTIVSMYMWAALQTHRVLQGYIEFDFIAHPEVSSVVVEHLIQTRVPMNMHQALKDEMSGVKSSVKAATTLVETLESKLSRQAENIVILLQDVKGLKK